MFGSNNQKTFDNNSKRDTDSQHKRRTPEYSGNESDLHRGKKQRSCEQDDQNTSCTGIASFVGGLTETVRQGYNSVQGGNNIVSLIKRVENQIPMVVFFGAQSSGKSVLIQKMFNLKIKTGTGRATRIPIEYRFGPDQTNDVSFQQGDKITRVDGNIDETSLDECISEVELKHIPRSTPIQAFSNMKIVCNIKHDESLMVVDLPDVLTTKNSADNQEKDNYFEFLRHRYLNPANSIVLHVTRGDNDPDEDASNRYVTECKNRICVLTNTDVWKSHPDKIGYLKGQLDKKPYKIAVVSNEDIAPSEINDLINTHLAPKPNGLIIGHDVLFKTILDEVKNRSKSFPEIRDTLDWLNKCAANTIQAHASADELKKTIHPNGGRTQTPLEMHNFRQTAKQSVENLVGQSRFNADCRLMREKVSVRRIQEFKKHVPSSDKLAPEIQDGNPRSVEGFEDLDSIIKNYIGIMVNELRGVLVENINEYCEYYETQLIHVFDDLFKEFHQLSALVQTSKDALHKIIIDECEKQNTLIQRILDGFALKPYAPTTNRCTSEMGCKKIKEYCHEEIKIFREALRSNSCCQIQGGVEMRRITTFLNKLENSMPSSYLKFEDKKIKEYCHSKIKIFRELLHKIEIDPKNRSYEAGKYPVGMQCITSFLNNLENGISSVYREYTSDKYRYQRKGNKVEETVKRLWDSFSLEIYANHIRTCDLMMKSIEERIVFYITSCELGNVAENATTYDRKKWRTLENTINTVKANLDTIIQ